MIPVERESKAANATQGWFKPLHLCRRQPLQIVDAVSRAVLAMRSIPTISASFVATISLPTWA
jgi:hypothetical protein